MRSMNKNVIIIGAGGHGKVVADIVLASGDKLLGFLDDGKRKGTEILGIPVLGCVDDFVHYSDAEFVIAVGNAAARKQIAEKLNSASFYTAIHPSAVVSSLDTHIGEGTVVMVNCVVNPCAFIGNHCILNTASVIEHDNVIRDYAHISVGAKLGGNVSVGESTWVGIGAVISNGVSVCSDCMIGAGTVVVQSITEPGTYVGVPARKVK